MVKIKREVKHFVQEQRRPKLHHMCKKEGDQEQKFATHKWITSVMNPRSSRRKFSYATKLRLGVH